MHITVRLGDPLWRKTGQRRLELELPEGQTVADALAIVRARYPQAGADLRPDGQSAGERLPYQLFVNHNKISWEQAGQTILHDGDQVVLFLIVVGG